jgi:hypothetical protein
MEISTPVVIRLKESLFQQIALLSSYNLNRMKYAFLFFCTGVVTNICDHQGFEKITF